MYDILSIILLIAGVCCYADFWKMIVLIGCSGLFSIAGAIYNQQDFVLKLFEKLGDLFKDMGDNLQKQFKDKK